MGKGGGRMLKSFEELVKIDVKPYCFKRDGFYYLNWAVCVMLLHEHGAKKVDFLPVVNEKTGNSLFYTDIEFKDKNGITNRCYETKIKIVIDDNEFYMQSPVMNGQNPVKDNSMNQLRVWNSMCRSFVKGVAIHTGLGLNLWIDEERNPFEYIDSGDEPLATLAQIKTIKLLAEKHHIIMEEWLKKVNRTWETLTTDEAGMMLNALKEKYGDE